MSLLFACIAFYDQALLSKFKTKNEKSNNNHPDNITKRNRNTSLPINNIAITFFDHKITIKTNVTMKNQFI